MYKAPKNIKVVSFDGLLVNYCQDHGIGTLIRGVRTGADIEYELQMAHMNRELKFKYRDYYATYKNRIFIYKFITNKRSINSWWRCKKFSAKNVLDELERKTNGGNEKCM